MNNKQNMFWRLMLYIEIPMIVILFILTGGWLYMLKSVYLQPDTQALVQNSALLLLGLGFLLLTGIVVITVKGISDKVSDISNAVDQLITGDTALGLKKSEKKTNDQLDQIAFGLTVLAEKMNEKSIVTKRIAEGEFRSEIMICHEKDQLGININAIQQSIGSLINCLEITSTSSSTEGVPEIQPSKELCGVYQQVIEDVNLAFETVNEKMELYLAILDALPYRICVMNNNMKYIFINKVLGDVMISAGFVAERESVYCQDCSISGLVMCNTENCGVRALKERAVHSYSFDFMGSYFRMDTEAIKNKKGEIIGYVEIAHDTTPTMSIDVYRKSEVKRLEENLSRLASGNLNLDLNIKEPDAYTSEAANLFISIGDNLTRVKQSIVDLIDEASVLTQAVVKGNLQTKGDESKFNGSWKELICGMNSILEEIAKPIYEVSTVMDEISNGNFQIIVSGNYHGAFDHLKQSVNNTISGLKLLISEIAHITGEISHGNLNIENTEEYPGEFAAVSKALNIIIETLNRLLGDIKTSSEQVNSGANQVSDGSQTLAQGSTEQASSIQELSASIAEIAVQTRNNAVDANLARELTSEVMGNAGKGNVQMIEMQQSMMAINQSSRDISNIIKVIDDIAFQTNILALNAAVEAARAGQHGKGFAVVAEEVRTLAARSAEAAKETTGLIEGSITKVQEGTKIADDTAEALNEIVLGIEKVTNLTGNIALATNEQATAIVQINTGIDLVAQVVQQNSATAEQSAAASQELTSQAQLMEQSIAQFQLRNN